MQRATQAVAFATNLIATGQPAPDAVQYDVEPYLLTEWDTDLQGTSNQYLDLLGKLRTALNGKLALTVAIPFWFDGRQILRQGQMRPLSEWTIDATDGTVMMDYRDTRTAILECAASEIAYAGQTSKPMILAVDVQPDPEAFITFYEEGETIMNTELASCKTALAGQRGFAAFAVFPYEDWLGMKP